MHTIIFMFRFRVFCNLKNYTYFATHVTRAFHFQLEIFVKHHSLQLHHFTIFIAFVVRQKCFDSCRGSIAAAKVDVTLFFIHNLFSCNFWVIQCELSSLNIKQYEFVVCNHIAVVNQTLCFCI